MKELTPNGVYGDPTKSSAEKGKQIGISVTKALKGLVLEMYSLKDRKYISS
jgi:creatinine amidohydrolase/Fe(II)-dependent formamide hydrolase-like protein